ncbi:MAG: electron transport complex protein RnfB [Gammaproteobacteria bacterium]|jgi:electron transport complex protein RnfB
MIAGKARVVFRRWDLFCIPDAFVPARVLGNLKDMQETLTDQIDALLPQTQCTRCGYCDCAAYARALANGEAAINRCPPGGDAAIVSLAALLDVAPVELDSTCGEQGPRRVAFVDESWCIGCTLCIDACPVDAIVGAAKRMHTVIEPMCTGCELCIAPCPVECIHMEPARSGPVDATLWLHAQAPIARQRYVERNRRIAERSAARLEKKAGGAEQNARRRKALIDQAVARSTARRSELAL